MKDYEREAGINRSFGEFVDLYRKQYPKAALPWGRDELRSYLSLGSTRTIDSAVLEAYGEQKP